MQFHNVIFPYEGRECFGDVICINDKITKLEKKGYKGSFEGYLIPGFIDTHTHGFRGFSSEGQDLDSYLMSYLERGVTTVCPTVGPRSLEAYGNLVDRYSCCTQGAHMAGLHLEGPYLSPVRHGAISASSLYSIHLEELEAFLIMYGEKTAVMTMAPEVYLATKAVTLLKKYGVKTSFGHSDADYYEASECYEQGWCGTTHLYNAMRPFNHRKAGLIDFILKNRVPSEMICDGNHVNMETMTWTMDILGKECIHCISDGGESCGFSYIDGHILEIGGVVRNGAVYEDGVLAGSTKDLLDGFYKFIREFKYSLSDAVKLTSQNAADFLQLPRGRIKKGYDADLLYLDCDMELKEVYLSGRCVYKVKI